MAEPAIAVSGLRKSFGAKEAVAGIGLDIAAGSFPGSSGRTGQAGENSLLQLYRQAGEDDPREDGPSPNRSVPRPQGCCDVSARQWNGPARAGDRKGQSGGRAAPGSGRAGPASWRRSIRYAVA